MNVDQIASTKGFKHRFQPIDRQPGSVGESSNLATFGVVFQELENIRVDV
jgi:hypothetical protein